MNGEPAHSPLGASTCERWWNCPGSVKLIESAPPQTPSIYAAEGTVAHWLAAKLLMEKIPLQAPYRPGYIVQEGDFKIAVTDEMIEAVIVYINYIQELERQWQTKVQVEQKIHIEPNMFGTADAIIAVPYNRIIVVDFKYGSGVKVYPTENKQLLYYALGAYLALPADVQADIPIIQMVIVQPRAVGNAINSWEISADELLNWQHELAQRVANTKRDATILNPGSWCRFCPAAPLCPALQQQASETTQLAFSTVDDTRQLPVVAGLSQDTIVQVLEKADMVRDWLKAVEEYALAQVEAGATIPGYRLEERWGHRRWIADSTEETLSFLKTKLSAAMWKTELISPAQAVKKLKNLPGGENVEQFIEKPFLGYKLAKGESIGLIQNAFDAVE